MSRNAPKTIELYGRVAGVTFSNEHGSIKSRQKIIRNFCRDGSRLDVRPEPDNPHSANALGLWVEDRGVFWSKGWYKVGYIPNDDAGEIRGRLDKGWAATARVWKVVGGGKGMYYGLRINVFLNPPHREALPSRIDEEPIEIGSSDRAAPSPAEKSKGFSFPSPPVAILHDMKRVGRIAIWFGLGHIVLGMLVTHLIGRLSDILGLGVVLAAVGSGLWGVALTFLTKDVEVDEKTAVDPSGIV